MTTTPRPKRTPQAWAQQILEGVLHQRGSNGHQRDNLPMRVELKSSPIVLPKGQAIRSCQELNLAIKWKNCDEDDAVVMRRKAQEAEVKANASKTLSIPAYLPEYILWRFSARPAPDQPGMLELWIDLPQTRRSRAASPLALLGLEFANSHSAFVIPSNAAVNPGEDIYERMLREDNGK